MTQGVREDRVNHPRSAGGELGSTGQLEVLVACRGWSVGHVKSRPKYLIAERNLALAA